MWLHHGFVFDEFLQQLRYAISFLDAGYNVAHLVELCDENNVICGVLGGQRSNLVR